MIKVYHGLFFTTVNQFFPIKCDINIPSEFRIFLVILQSKTTVMDTYQENKL